MDSAELISRNTQVLMNPVAPVDSEAAHAELSEAGYSQLENAAKELLQLTEGEPPEGEKE
jgi:hypothetical protein